MPMKKNDKLTLMSSRLQTIEMFLVFLYTRIPNSTSRRSSAAFSKHLVIISFSCVILLISNDLVMKPPTLAVTKCPLERRNSQIRNSQTEEQQK